MPSSPTLPIETNRLVLRSFERTDIEGLSKYHALPSMQRYAFTPAHDHDQVPAALKTMCGHLNLHRPGGAL